MEQRTASGIILPPGMDHLSQNNTRNTNTIITSIPLEYTDGNQTSEEHNETTSSTFRPSDINNQYITSLNYVDERIKEAIRDFKVQQQELIDNKISTVSTEYDNKISAVSTEYDNKLTTLTQSHDGRIGGIEEKLKENKDDKKHSQTIMYTIITVLITIVLPVITGVVLVTKGKFDDLTETINRLTVVDEKIENLEDDSEDLKKDIEEMEKVSQKTEKN
ncbi:hypothetical protein [Peribacillus asahii]|uniref:hypothetical protein n=1 Tax=Peribacillus asahii TaxID=228899 RepID=UPI003816EA57